MKKTIDQILTEKSEKEARAQLQPWKEKMEALFLEADLLVKPPKTAQYFPSTYIRDVDIAYPGTVSTLRLAVKNQEPVTLPASQTLNRLFEAAVKIKAEHLLAQHQEKLAQHYDELPKEL